MKAINSIKIKRFVDELSNTRDLGEYSDAPGKNVIDRVARGDVEEYQDFRYFNAAMSAEGTGNPNSVEQDYQRAEAFNRGDWHYVGVRAEAEIVVDGIIQTISSGSLCGIKSDEGEEYFTEVGGEQLGELVVILKELGFTQEAIDHVV